MTKRYRKVKKVHRHGYVFDSEGEADRASYLVSLESENVISNLILDKDKLTITLQDNFVLSAIPEIGLQKSPTIPSVTYTPDFAYHYAGMLIYEDYKAPDLNKKRKGRPVIEPSSSIRIRLFHKYLKNTPNTIFRVCTIATANPDDTQGYWYSLHERK